MQLRRGFWGGGRARALTPGLQLQSLDAAHRRRSEPSFPPPVSCSSTPLCAEARFRNRSSGLACLEGRHFTVAGITLSCLYPDR